MAARDRWTIALQCPSCGQTDDALVSEDDYAYMRHPNFSVDCVRHGRFVVACGAKHRHETEVRCTGCGEQFHL